MRSETTTRRLLAVVAVLTLALGDHQSGGQPARGTDRRGVPAGGGRLPDRAGVA